MTNPDIRIKRHPNDVNIEYDYLSITFGYGISPDDSQKDGPNHGMDGP
jgi:hypothetical protein